MSELRSRKRQYGLPPSNQRHNQVLNWCTSVSKVEDITIVDPEHPQPDNV